LCSIALSVCRIRLTEIHVTFSACLTACR
jgi:hypothetical protein